MLEEKLQKKYLARSEEDVAVYIGQNRKLIVVEKPLAQIPRGYTQVTMTYKSEKHIVLIPEKAKFFMANPGEEGNPLEALDEIAGFYAECREFEHELMYGSRFSVAQTNVSTLARNSYGIWAMNQLVRQQPGSEIPEWNEQELERLGFNDPYVRDRARGIAAIMTGKTVEQLREAGLESLLVHKTVQGTFREILTGKEFENITCWAGSHYELKPEFRNQGYDLDRRHDQSHRVGWKIEREKEFSHSPTIEKLEQEIADYRQTQGKETTRHDRALVRTVVNLKYIAQEDPNLQLDVMDDA